jgi:hypothetical protein
MKCFRFRQVWQDFRHRSLIAAVLLGGFNLLTWSSVTQVPSVAQTQVNAYCQLSAEAIAQADALRQAAWQGDPTAQAQYRTLINQQSQQMQQCRSRIWPSNQAIWLRLYPCDAQPGKLDEIFDRVVGRGYNQVYVEVFHDGQVLLPAADNPTAWASIVRSPGYEHTDLLQAAIAKGRERGLKVYAWMFTLNFGYAYSLRPEQEPALARNGRGDTSLTALSSGNGGIVNNSEIFVDPYSPQAKRDFQILLQAVLKRNPDGVLFDYIRYPLGYGGDSVASQVEDLWIYGPSSQQALYDRALNPKGRELIERFVRQGRITAADVSAVNARYPQNTAPLWQGHRANIASTEQLQNDLWLLTVAHAVQGVLDFLSMSAQLVQQQGIPAGAAFFPEANQQVGDRGYDSRLQPWDRFPASLEWHPMSYAICGEPSCVVAQVQRVLDLAPSGTEVIPVLAGTWGQAVGGHPPLEQQMNALRQATPQLNSVSHFAYSWQNAAHDRDRRTCQP